MIAKEKHDNNHILMYFNLF